MAAPASVPAKPPTFHFKTRLVDSAGNVFAGRDYELWWGGKLVQDGITDASGGVEAYLDDAHKSGVLDLGEVDASGKFTARLTIPIDAVPSPPPPPKPAKGAVPAPPPAPPGKNEHRSRKESPGWTDENDPEPYVGEPPRNAEDELRRTRYAEELQAHKKWRERQEQRQRDAREQRRKAEDEWDTDKKNDELRKQWHGGAIPVMPPAEAQARPMDAMEQKEREARLQRIREELHAGAVVRYEIAWRLRNLGFLPGTVPLSFPIMGSDADRLLEAMQRFAWKCELVRPGDADLAGSASPVMKTLLDEVRKEHDG